jgi:hypothetical protein
LTFKFAGVFGGHSAKKNQDCPLRSPWKQKGDRVVAG